MIEQPISWLPAAVLAAGIALTLGISSPRPRSLRTPLAMSIPDTIAGYVGHDITLAEDERTTAAPTSYLVRAFIRSAGQSASLYIGYYGTQAQGKTIHSPKNCLPGAGWEALSSQTTVVPTSLGEFTVNHYLIQHKTSQGPEQSLVLYWYQGRGRVVANEYAVKWNLLRDAVLKQRSDEALVRIVVPITTDPAAAFTAATQLAAAIVPALAAALPR